MRNTIPLVLDYAVIKHRFYMKQDTHTLLANSAPGSTWGLRDKPIGKVRKGVYYIGGGQYVNRAGWLVFIRQFCKEQPCIQFNSY